MSAMAKAAMRRTISMLKTAPAGESRWFSGGYRRGVAAVRAYGATPQTVAGRPGGRSATLTAIGNWYQSS
jgi:hypothetical protein